MHVYWPNWPIWANCRIYIAIWTSVPIYIGNENEPPINNQYEFLSKYILQYGRVSQYHIGAPNSIILQSQLIFPYLRLLCSSSIARRSIIWSNMIGRHCSEAITLCERKRFILMNLSLLFWSVGRQASLNEVQYPWIFFVIQNKINWIKCKPLTLISLYRLFYTPGKTSRMNIVLYFTPTGRKK